MSNLVDYSAIITDEEVRKAILRARAERSAIAVNMLKSIAKIFKFKSSNKEVTLPNGKMPTAA